MPLTVDADALAALKPYRVTAAISGAHCTITARDGTVTVGTVTLQHTAALPYLVSTRLTVTPDYRGRGVTAALDAATTSVARSSARIGILAAVHADNIPQLARLFRRGWRCIHYGRERYLFARDVAS